MRHMFFSGGVDTYDQLILEPEDWSPEEWATILKIFGLKKAERIELTEYKVHALAEKAEA